MASKPHPQTLFRLVPLTPMAVSTVKHPRNGHLRLDYGRTGCLEIGRHPSRVGDGLTLATLGRQGDVYIETTQASRTQCSFELDLESKMVMLYDKSNAASTQVDRHAASTAGIMPIRENAFPRRVCVHPGLNPVVRMCGAHRDMIKFFIEWIPGSDNRIGEKIDHGNMGYGVQHDFLKTGASGGPNGMDNADTAAESVRLTRARTPGMTRNLRSFSLGFLGSGGFGTVSKAVNVDTGTLMAVKSIQRKPNWSDVSWQKVQREVKNLSGIAHPCIVNLIWSTGWTTMEAKIFMGLKDGSLDDLIESESYSKGTMSMPLIDLAATMLHHMLQALDVLACRGIIHRDVKPSNILYTVRAGLYCFQLGDFGFSSRESQAGTDGGTLYFIAPEMPAIQSSKVDVWALYVSLLWTMNPHGFFEQMNASPTLSHMHNLVVAKSAEDDDFPTFREMAALDPNQRASAAQMLLKNFGGRGLVTPVQLIPPLYAPMLGPSTKGNNAQPSTNMDLDTPEIPPQPAEQPPPPAPAMAPPVRPPPGCAIADAPVASPGRPRKPRRRTSMPKDNQSKVPRMPGFRIQKRPSMPQQPRELPKQQSQQQQQQKQQQLRPAPAVGPALTEPRAQSMGTRNSWELTDYYDS